MKALLVRPKRQFLVKKIEAKHWLDVWLPRVSHFSQFGLFVITIGGFYFTVLPLYQKAVLEEAIARKEIELKASEKLLKESYAKIRSFTISSFVFSAGAECSGLMIPAGELDSPRTTTHAEDILSIDAAKCLSNELRESESLRQLREPDLKALSSRVEEISIELTSMRKKALQVQREIPSRARKDPSILEPIGRLRERALSLLAIYQDKASVESKRLEYAIEETQSVAASQYAQKVRELISTLRAIEWK
jgi:hypothetical protein